MRLLIVEDDETIAGFLAKGLREAGFTVEQSRGPPERVLGSVRSWGGEAC